MESSKDRNYFNNKIRLLKMFGVNLSGSEESLEYRIYSVLLIGVTVCAFPTLAAADLLSDDFGVVSQMMVYVVFCFAAIAKAVVMFRNRVKIGAILRKLGKEPFIPNQKRGGDVEEELTKNCVVITKAQTFMYWTLTAVSYSIPNVYCLIKRLTSDDYHDWKLPFAPLTFLNVTSSPYFELVWLYQSLSIAFIAVHFVTTDLIISAVLIHIAHQFKILQINLRRLVENCYAKMHKDFSVSLKALPQFEEGKVRKSVIFWKYLQMSLKEAVDYHLAIIDIAEEIEVVFSSLLLIVTLNTLGALGFSIYRVSAESTAGATIIRALTDMMAGYFQILIICYWGEQVMFESQQVGNAAYEARFVGTDLRFQKGLALIMRRSLNPTEITAGKFTPLSLSTFVWIARAGYSAFMVVASRQNDET